MIPKGPTMTLRPNDDYPEWNDNVPESSMPKAAAREKKSPVASISKVRGSEDVPASEDAYWDDAAWDQLNSQTDAPLRENSSSDDSSAEYSNTEEYAGDDQYEPAVDPSEVDDLQSSIEWLDTDDELSDDELDDDPAYDSADVIIEADVPMEYEPLVTRWVAGIVASLVLHLWMVSTFSSMTLDNREYETVVPIESKIGWDEPEPEPIEVVEEFELANPDDEEKEQQTALNAKSVGLIQSEKPVQEVAPQLEIENEVALNSSAPVFDIPEGMELDESIVVQGTTGDGIIQIDAALDRVTWEIASQLKLKKVLVVWLMDSSGSLSEQRKIVAKRMRRIYDELNALETAGQIPNQDQPLLSAVVTFGQGTDFMTPSPTANVEELISQLQKAPADQSGVENVFGAVRKVVEKWSNLRRRILVMAITDEAGDDFGQHLNPAINMLNKVGGKAYVIGPPAIFGKRQGFVPYLAPENGQTYQIPVDIGPESAMGENVQLPFWFGGPQYENLSSGLGPYALARLVHETGGVYFMTNMTTAAGLTPTGTYAAQTMKLFAPDYRFGSTDEYLRDIQKRPIRLAVHRAHELSLKYKALGTPELELRVNPNNYIRTLATAQQTVAVSTAMIDEILTAFPPSLEQAYLKEESPRWRMAYNLSFGRLLAQRLRCMEYNTALAQLKLLGTQDITTRVNHFVFRPDPNINYAAGMKKPKDLSEMLLKRCVNDAPGTPWAILAARELQYPYGIKVIERFDPPPPPPTAAAVANAAGKKKGILLLADDTKRKPATPPPPPVPPKLPKY